MDRLNTRRSQKIQTMRERSLDSSYYSALNASLPLISDDAVHRQIIEDLYKQGEVDDFIKAELEYHNIMNEFNFTNIYQRVNEDFA